MQTTPSRRRPWATGAPSSGRRAGEAAPSGSPTAHRRPRALLLRRGAVHAVPEGAACSPWPTRPCLLPAVPARRQQACPRSLTVLRTRPALSADPCASALQRNRLQNVDTAAAVLGHMPAHTCGPPRYLAQFEPRVHLPACADTAGHMAGTRRGSRRARVMGHRASGGRRAAGLPLGRPQAPASQARLCMSLCSTSCYAVACTVWATPGGLVPCAKMFAW
jgi:hypothetical protein